MFRDVRYGTGEINEIIGDMRKGNIPAVDVDDEEELHLFFGLLEKKGVCLRKDIPFDKHARDRIKEVEFEFRAAFYFEENPTATHYIDFYFEPFKERTYASVFGD